MNETKKSLCLVFCAAFISHLLTFWLQKIETIRSAHWVLQLFVLFFIVTISAFGVHYFFEAIEYDGV